MNIHADTACAVPLEIHSLRLIFVVVPNVLKVSSSFSSSSSRRLHFLVVKSWPPFFCRRLFCVVVVLLLDGGFFAALLATRDDDDDDDDFIRISFPFSHNRDKMKSKIDSPFFLFCALCGAEEEEEEYK